MNLPDDTMKDVRVVHDAVGSYADWLIVNGVLPYGDRKERYLIGKAEPHYPMPAVRYDWRWCGTRLVMFVGCAFNPDIEDLD